MNTDDIKALNNLDTSTDEKYVLNTSASTGSINVFPDEQKKHLLLVWNIKNFFGSIDSSDGVLTPGGSSDNSVYTDNRKGLARRINDEYTIEVIGKDYQCEYIKDLLEVMVNEGLITEYRSKICDVKYYIVNNETEALSALKSMAKNKDEVELTIYNPPFSDDGNKMHLQFTDEILAFSKNAVGIMPVDIATHWHKTKGLQYDGFRQRMTPRVTSIQEVKGNLFAGVEEEVRLGVYTFAESSTQCQYTYTDGSTRIVHSIDDLKYDNDIEESIFETLCTNNVFQTKNGAVQFNEYAYIFGKYEYSPADIDGVKQLQECRAKAKAKKDDITFKELGNKILKLEQDYWEEPIKYDTAYLGFKYAIIAGINIGGQTRRFITSNTDKVFTIDELKEHIHQECNSSGYNLILFKHQDAAERCLNALKNPLLRLTLKFTQVDKHMKRGVYRCVPLVDWTNNIASTDAGILALCNCNESKCQEYADYAASEMAKFDEAKTSGK